MTAKTYNYDDETIADTARWSEVCFDEGKMGQILIDSVIYGWMYDFVGKIDKKKPVLEAPQFQNSLWVPFFFFILLKKKDRRSRFNFAFFAFILLCVTDPYAGDSLMQMHLHKLEKREKERENNHKTPTDSTYFC